MQLNRRENPEHEVQEGDAPKVVIRITGRPLTFPAGDQ